MSVKVLLVIDVEKLGWFGDVIEVASGYARNYLLPQGLAILPTQANLKSLEKEKHKRAEQRKGQRKQLEEATLALEGTEAVVAATTNELGHLFGSVGCAEIAANLREQGLLPAQPSHVGGQRIVFEDSRLKVTDDVIKIDEKIKQVGSTQAKVRFADDLTATINVVVVSENHQIASVSTESDEQSESESSDAESSESPKDQAKPTDTAEPTKDDENTEK